MLLEKQSLFCNGDQATLTMLNGVLSIRCARMQVFARERTRQLQWDVFLARLQHDLNDTVRFSQLYPSARTNPRKDAARACHSSTSSANDDIEARIREVLIRNGPVLAPNETLQLCRVVAVTLTPPSMRSSSNPKAATESKKNMKPSLHFGDSGVDVWTDLVRASIRAVAPTPAVSSSRRANGRCQPPSTQTHSFVAATGSGGARSEIRQLATTSTLQFPCTECDVPLSSACVSWLLKDPYYSDADLSCRWMCTLDVNVYFDLDEYEQSLETAATDKTRGFVHSIRTSVSSSQAISDVTTLESAKRAMHSVNMVVERTRRDSPTLSSSCNAVLAKRRLPPATTTLTERKSTFVRATVLQLLQTAYYATQFLPQLSASDNARLEHLCVTHALGTS